MGKKIPHLKKIINFKKKIDKDIHINKMLLFGSLARGNYKRWSDIDLLVVSEDFKNIKKVRRPVRLYDYWTYKYPVDFFCYTPKEFKRLSKRITIVREAIKEGIEI